MSWIKRMGLLLVAGLLAVTPLLAGAAAPKSPAKQPPVPLLWKVSGGQGSELYLLGSFHLLKADDYPLSADVDRAFAGAQRLLFELSPE